MKEVYLDLSDNKLHIVSHSMENAVTIDISMLLKHDYDHLINFISKLSDLPLLDARIYDKNSAASIRALSDAADYCANNTSYQNPYSKYTEFNNWNNYEITWRKAVK